MTEWNHDPSSKTSLIFARTVAAQLARVSLEFLDRLEAEDLIQPRELEGGDLGYTPEDIQRLSRIRRLHDTLGLDLAAVEVVLRLREQVVDMLARMEDMEKRFNRREQDLVKELNELRRRFLVTREWG
jgi:MerR family transcriptional regulator/heat shock protein HspR